MAFDPFGKLAEVERYKMKMNMRFADMQARKRQNALAQAQQERRNRIQDNALAQAAEDRAMARAGRARYERGGEWMSNNPDATPRNVYDAGFPTRAKELKGVMPKDNGMPPSRFSIVPTSTGVMRVDKLGVVPATMVSVGERTPLPTTADVDLTKRKEETKKNVHRISKLKTNLPKAKASLSSFKIASENLKTTIDEAIANTNGKTAGWFGSKTSGIEGTDAFTLAESLKTIQSADAFRFLQEMRQNSPTGGSVGQLSDSEREVMGLIKASTKQGLDPLVLIKNLSRIKDLTDKITAQAERGFAEDFALVLGGEIENTPSNSMNEAPQAGNKVGRFTVEVIE